MTKSKTTIRYHIQGSIDEGPWHDIDSKGFLSMKQAERKYNQILRECYPIWRGLSIFWKIVKRQTTVTSNTEIKVFATPSHGKKRTLLGEMLVPCWLSEKEKERLKMRRIPDAPEHWQPTSQLPILNNNLSTKSS